MLDVCLPEANVYSRLISAGEGIILLRNLPWQGNSDGYCNINFGTLKQMPTWQSGVITMLYEWDS